ncbi:hypothetical protein [Algoriphagus sp.]|uniref:hypothetical protein n=1 Tax=Algoriphagus sp. TaxID=1872435 RepID=UPI00391CC6D8
MKKFLLVAFVFAMGLSFNIGGSQKVEAGPFGNQGHWVPMGGGGEVCATHWWLNKCIVGQERETDS